MRTWLPTQLGGKVTQSDRLTRSQNSKTTKVDSSQMELNACSSTLTSMSNSRQGVERSLRAWHRLFPTPNTQCLMPNA
ncbi:hypothetical protein FD723_41160 (plasmid) [Nostoc sp. C052]|nr:hypothetical protein FD723_41160 [Nostoc sp. C052]